MAPPSPVAITAGWPAAPGWYDHLHSRASAFPPVTGEIMEIASELWVYFRKEGLPTGPDERLDGNAILVATAIVVDQAADEVIVATRPAGALGLEHIPRDDHPHLVSDILMSTDPESSD